MKTMNVRCCCSPGLVLGRLPYDGLPAGRRATFNYALRWPSVFESHDTITHTRLDASFVVQMAWVEAPGIDYENYGARRRVPELAYNSNHAAVEDLENLIGFELVCNLPDDYFGEQA